MSRVDFYHLQNQRLEDVLPKLLEKAYGTGKKIVVKIGNEERVEFLNSLLWTYNDTSFLPHGSPAWLPVPHNRRELGAGGLSGHAADLADCRR